MHLTRTVLGAIAALIGTGSATAADLFNANAYPCGIAPPAVERMVSEGQGGRAFRDRIVELAGNLDPEFPSMVKLQVIYEKEGYTEIDHCGGTVIDSRWILTAAHCVAADSSWSRVDIVAGDASLEGATRVFRTTRDAVCHSGFDYGLLTNDIAMLRLDEPLPAEIVHAALDQYRHPSVMQGDMVYAAGWPVTGSDAGLTNLTKTRLRVEDVSWPGYITVASPHGAPEGVCRGESGGPLMSRGPDGRMQLAGVLSGIEPNTHDASGRECMKGGYSMYFTPVAGYRMWIDQVRGICDADPESCEGGGATFFVASAN